MITDDDLHQDFDCTERLLSDQITKLVTAVETLTGAEGWESLLNARKLLLAAKRRELAILHEIRRRLAL